MDSHAPQYFLQLHMRRRKGSQIRTAYHIGNAHADIINYVGQVITVNAVRIAQENVSHFR